VAAACWRAYFMKELLSEEGAVRLQRFLGGWHREVAVCSTRGDPAELATQLAVFGEVVL
jgi:hypothetical protein